MHLAVDERQWHGWPDGGRGAVRAFGERAADLDVDFAAGRAALVTALLQRCLRREGEWNGDEVWSWTLAQRLQGLIAIALASGVPPMALLQRCGACDEMLELGIDPKMFERDERVTCFRWMSPDGASMLEVSLPTGDDQRRWSAAGALSMRAMARALVREVDGRAPEQSWQIPDAWIDALGEALEAHDPLTSLELNAPCPACGTVARIAFDLEAQLLGALHARQRRTLSEIHRLASAYHWGEAAILELPAWRRRHYLAQLASAGDA